MTHVKPMIELGLSQCQASRPGSVPLAAVDPMALPPDVRPLRDRHHRSTAVDSNGHPHGMTVNSFSSVSLDPPLVLVSIDLRNAILGHFLSSSWFAINILAEASGRLSRPFSAPRRTGSMGRLARGRIGVPAARWRAGPSGMRGGPDVRSGDHTVLMGEVRLAGYAEGRPLVYFDSSYRMIG